ncbi:plant/protein [Wolffia australiana]
MGAPLQLYPTTPPLNRASALSPSLTFFPPSISARSSRSSPSPARPLVLHRRCRRLPPISSSQSDSSTSEFYVQTLRVPDSWLESPKAIEESEWLRATLHKWLDDEYCPEEMNVEISRVAAQSYLESLLSGNPEMGEILIKMAMDLESLSYQESFHGAFSAANAAVRLITQRMDSA